MESRLTLEECKEAIRLCGESRPMRDEPSIKIFPYLAKWCPCCFNKQKKEEKLQKKISKIGDSVLSKLTLQFKRQESSLEDQQNFKSKIQEAKYKRTIREYPFLIFGRGIEGWLQLLETLIFVFFILSIIACIQIFIFKK